MRRLSERALATINEGGAHAVALGADAVEDITGEERTSLLFVANHAFD